MTSKWPPVASLHLGVMIICVYLDFSTLPSLVAGGSGCNYQGWWDIFSIFVVRGSVRGLGGGNSWVPHNG